jgi:hypothetical protein
MGEYRLLLKHVDVPNYHDIQVYEQYGGYQALRKALSDGAPSGHRGGQKVGACAGAAAQGSLRGLNGTASPKTTTSPTMYCATPTRASQALSRTSS